MTQIIRHKQDRRQQISQAWENSEPFIVIEPRRKYGAVRWNSDPVYPYRGTGFEEVCDLVDAYSLAEAGHGVTHGYVRKIRLSEIQGFAEKLARLLDRHVTHIP
jgi:hypothetical protein